MGLMSAGGLLVLLLISVNADKSSSFGVGVEVGGGGGVGVEVDLCEGVECEEGDECQVVVSPLLQLPVAHCVHSDAAPPPRDQDACSEITVGTNVLSCKSKREWQRVGVRQCLLRTSQGVGLAGVKVQHACHSRQYDRIGKFLSATFTCCPQDQLAATPPPATTGSNPPSSPPTSAPSTPPTSAPSTPPREPVTTYQQQPFPDEAGSEGSKGVEEGSGHASILIPVVLGTVVLMAVVITALVWRHRHRNHSVKPPTLTFFVNESSDGFGEGLEGDGEGEGGGRGSGDTALILPNKHSSCGK